MGVEDPDAFWATVATNLEAERFRLIFVSDVIPPELRRIIEFLNGQMANTEVLAIEVKQYVDDKKLAPDDRAARHRQHRDREADEAQRDHGPIDRASLLAALAEKESGAADAAEALLDWAEERPDLGVRWNTAGDIGLGVGQALLRIQPEGTVEVKVNTLRKLDPAWDDDERIEQLLQRLEEIDGVMFFKATGDSGRAQQLAPLADHGSGRPSLPSSPTLWEGWRAKASVLLRPVPLASEPGWDRPVPV